ncbi:MAG TPA: hypothetical protein EYG70_08440, partial [Sulfurimonas sp.]|nr:hypothetical protein [Sulfurimonas sp.]
KYIKEMEKSWTQYGLDFVKTINTDTQVDYEINAVKVTFYASGLKNLRAGASTFFNVHIASVDTIIAMKMDAIINYRTKSRDFYDIYTIAKDDTVSLSRMLDLYNQHTSTYCTDELIQKRLTKHPLDKDDEGLQGLNATGLKSFTALRAWLTQKIEDEAIADNSVIIDIVKSAEKIKDYTDKCFGLTRLSLVQKYATLGKDDMVEKCLMLSAFDLFYKNISGKHILSYFEDNLEMYKKILYYAIDIPPELMTKDPKFLTEHQRLNLQLLKLEHSIVGCTKTDCSQERIEINAEKFGITSQEYFSRVEGKRRLRHK